MRKFLVLFGIALCLSLSAAAADDSPADPAAPVPAAAAPVDQHPPGYIFMPDRGRVQFGVGYQYQSYNVFGRTFHDNGYNIGAVVGVGDWITGATARLTVAAEATAAFGFGGETSGKPILSVKSLFAGAGPHLSIQSESRFEPWIHLLPGVQHFRFSQAGPFGSNSAFGFMAGAGLDFKISRRVYWRVQGDYLGTNFTHGIDSNYSVGTGFVINY